MNNTTRGEAVRSIMSRKYDHTDTKLIELNFQRYAREIDYMISNLEFNEKHTKALEAITYLLKTLDD